MDTREATLRDGTVVRIRDIEPGDRDELVRGFERLSQESRYRRFLGAFNSLSPSMLDYLTHVDGRDHVAIVALVDTAEGERGAGVARFVRLRDEPTVAEAAIAVADEMQGKGLGLTLTLILAEEARRRGIERFRGEVLIDNQPCRALLADLGARLKTIEDGRLAFDVPLPGDAEELRRAARGIFRASRMNPAP